MRACVRACVRACGTGAEQAVKMIKDEEEDDEAPGDDSVIVKMLSIVVRPTHEKPAVCGRPPVSLPHAHGE